MLPFLHRPTFMKAFNDGWHFRDDKFGALVLLVCATASRYSHDPRTLEGGHLHSAGWKWFNQVEPFASIVLSCPELYDLQVAVVSVFHQLGRSFYQTNAVAFYNICSWHVTAPRNLDYGGHKSTISPGTWRPPPTTAPYSPNGRG